MNLFEQLRTRMHEQLLRKNLPTRQVERSSLSLDQAKSIGILFDGSKPEDRELVLNYAKKLKGQGKKVKLMAYFDSDLKSENFTYWHFNKKQVDWALRPKTKEAEDFAQRPFDLLINLSRNAIIPLEYIAALSKARFRVGPSTEKTFCYDLMIEHDSKQDLKVFLQQVVHYLKNMRSDQLATAV